MSFSCADAPGDPRRRIRVLVTPSFRISPATVGAALAAMQVNACLQCGALRAQARHCGRRPIRVEGL